MTLQKINTFLKLLFLFACIIILTQLQSCSCSKEDKKYSTWEMWDMASEADPTVKLVPITDPSKRILCINYGPGCVKASGKRLKIRKVELITVEFRTPEDAKKEAKRLNQYYIRNWLFDDVNGEPVLEDFIIKVFEAKKGRTE